MRDHCLKVQDSQCELRQVDALQHCGEPTDKRKEPTLYLGIIERKEREPTEAKLGERVQQCGISLSILSDVCQRFMWDEEPQRPISANGFFNASNNPLEVCKRPPSDK